MADLGKKEWKEIASVVLTTAGKIVLKSLPWAGWGLLALAEIIKFF